MTKEQKDELIQARDLIFKVEQEWRKGKGNKEYAANTLYQARIEINNAMNRG